MPVENKDPIRPPSSDANSLIRHLIIEWNKALAGEGSAQSEWKIEVGGDWLWTGDGVRVKGTGSEWSNLTWQSFDGAVLNLLGNFIIELTVSGKAEAAGLSFGDFKDFLVGFDSYTGSRNLQLEIDVNARCWAFRVDGQLQHRAWWDSAVQSIDDLLKGVLSFKARRVEEVHFQDLAIHTFQSSCQLSIILTCYRFLQRLRVTLDNWCHQTLPFGGYEVFVVNPGSPDGTHEHLAAVAVSYPHVRIRELSVDSKFARNKGAMINHAFRASRGEWIWLADSDCLFPPDAAKNTLAKIQGRTSRLFYGQRRYLTSSQTSELLAGRRSGLRDFDDLCHISSPRGPDSAPWGYTQIVQRSTLERIPYRESINHYAHSDSLFIEDCKRHRIPPEPVEGLFCLHLDHPFAWYGTNVFL